LQAPGCWLTAWSADTLDNGCFTTASDLRLLAAMLRTSGTTGGLALRPLPAASWETANAGVERRREGANAKLSSGWVGAEGRGRPEMARRESITGTATRNPSTNPTSVQIPAQSQIYVLYRTIPCLVEALGALGTQACTPALVFTILLLLILLVLLFFPPIPAVPPQCPQKACSSSSSSPQHRATPAQPKP
jgi:hypothetical protein